MATRRVLDVIFCGYFIFQIPSTLFFDTQALFPACFYPSWLRNARANYLDHYRDPFMADTSCFPWFMAVCAIEFSMEIPLFFVASYAFYKGAARCPWIRVPCLIYAVHTFTAVLGVLFVVCLDDFSRYPVPGPRDFKERSRLFFVYFPFLLSCLVLIFDTCCSTAYREKKKTE